VELADQLAVADDDRAQRLAAEERLVRALDDVEPLDVEARLVGRGGPVEPGPASIALGWGI
jgi:hypothetical protein